MNPEHEKTIRGAPLPWFTEAVPNCGATKIFDAHDNCLFVCRPDLAQMIVEAVNKLESER